MNQNNSFVPPLFFFIDAIQLFGCGKGEVSRHNILLITADDMSYSSPGFAGGEAPEVTLNIDRLAE